ncbi:MAG: hypothetical protein LC800_22575 [Acidobacteria bacterium]|nr:hypothetical protein [Acidobacteriota bacterium]
MFARVSGAGLLWGCVMFVVTFAVSSAVAAFVIVKMPANYFHSSHGREFLTGSHPTLRWAGVIVKNLVGLVLLILGVVMMVAPGPGLLTILLGVTLLDFPGKRRLELKLVSRPAVRHAIDRIRARFHRPPLLLD